MDNTDYKLAMLEIISMIKDKATYIKHIDKDEYLKNAPFYEGMQLTYHFVLDGIIGYIEANEGMKLADFGLDNFNSNEITKYKPEPLL